MTTPDDVGAMYKAWDDIKRAKKLSNKEHSTGLLTALGIPFTSHNNGVHLKLVATLDGVDRVVNFWPSTGLWQVQGEKLQTRGVRKLIKLFVDTNH